jgi:hypothetical protein
MGLFGYNNPRQLPDVLSGQDCTLRERAKNEPRQESVARQVPLWDMEAPLALAADSGRMTGKPYLTD